MADRWLVIRQATSWQYSKNAVVVALVVGSVLNVINQGDRIFADLPINWVKIGLTYLVPYFVATYGAFNALRKT